MFRTIFKPYIQRYIKPFSASILILGIEAICDVTQPTLLAFLIDRGVLLGDKEAIVHYGILMISVTLFGACNALIRNYLSSQVAYGFARDLRKDLFKKIIHMKATERLKFDTGSFMNRMTSDVLQLQNFTVGMMRIFLKAPLLGLGSMIMVFRLSADLFTVFLLLLPLVALIMTLHLNMGYPLYSKVQFTLDKLNEGVRSFLSGIRVVRAFHRFDYEKEHFEQRNGDNARCLETAVKSLSVFGPLMGLCIQLTIVYVLYKSQLWVPEGRLSVGMVVAFIQYMLQFLFSVMVITRVFNLFVRAKSSSERVAEILSVPEIKESVTEVYDLPTLKSFAFEDVDFSYANGDSVLSEITVQLVAGKFYALVGGTGAGKSTFLKLLVGIYEPTKGRIVINNSPQGHGQQYPLNQIIGYVPQKSLLFSGTIEENIRFGNDKATAAELDAVIGIAQLKPFIESSPKGLHTIVGRGGISVSGGQKQRIAIARALLRKPQLLILDDCTSALDSLTEAALRKALANQMEGLTIMMVSQRVVSVQDAEMIFVMSQGKIVAQGQHLALKERSQWYASLCETQLESGGEAT